MRATADVGPSPGRLTPYVRLDDVLVGHAAALHEALGETFVGVYLLGSLAIGDFDLTSDVDLMVVTRDEPTDEQMTRVGSAHLDRVSQDDRWVKHLEYSVVPLPVLHTPSSPYRPDGTKVEAPERDLWYFDNGSRTAERSDHDNTLVSRWTLRYRSRAVRGPEPASFAPEVTADALRHEIRSSMLGWERLVQSDPGRFDNRFHQVFLVLNGCRALQDLHEGRITSKKQGVAWARRHLDPQWHDLVDFCWRERQDTGIHVSQPADREAFRRTVAFVGHTARLAAAHRSPSEQSRPGREHPEPVRPQRRR